MIDYARAKAFKEVFDMLAIAGTTAENIRKQMAEPEKNYEI